MATVKIVPGRSGCVWPRVLRTVRESRQEGRLLILYVPEQYTLQAERDLITGLGLPGLLDIQVISPRKLRQQVRERMGSGARKPLNEFGRAMAVHRVMSENAKDLTYYRNMADLPGAVRRVGEALSELRESEITPEELAEGETVHGQAAEDHTNEKYSLADAFKLLIKNKYYLMICGSYILMHITRH